MKESATNWTLFARSRRRVLLRERADTEPLDQPERVGLLTLLDDLSVIDSGEHHVQHLEGLVRGFDTHKLVVSEGRWR